MINELTNSKPRISADPKIAQQKLSFAEKQFSVWDLLETLGLKHGWTLKETGERTLELRPAD